MKMQKKTIAMIMVAGCAATLLTGCGIPEEEHLKVVNERDAKIVEIDKLKGDYADLQSLLDAEKAKVRTARIEQDDLNGRLSKAKASEATIASALASEKSKVSRLESNLSNEKSKSQRIQANVNELETELEALKEQYKQLEKRWEQFENNLNTLDTTVGTAEGGAPVAGKSTGGVNSAAANLNTIK
jgi:chromosome segregation ATPase